MIKDENREICIGCTTGNHFLCRSFAGAAPKHATRHSSWMKQRAKDRQAERIREEEEMRIARVFHRAES